MPRPVATFIQAVNDHDADALLSAFANDAVVADVGREFRGTAAIKEWSDREIFEANVTFDVIDVAEHDGQTVIPSKVDGTFDRAGLPDPLLLEHRSHVKGGKIAAFSSRLGGEEPRP